LEQPGDKAMSDAIVLAVCVGFFVLTIAYVSACERLQGGPND
jgi:hypothetical protein